MFNLELFALLGSSSAISPTSVKFFCRLVADVDVSLPHSLKLGLLARRYHLKEEERRVARRYLNEFLAAGVLEQYVRVRQGSSKQSQSRNNPLYRVKPKWCLTANELAEEVERQEELRGREALISP